MFNIGDWIYAAFGDNGEYGVLLCIFLIFLIDALIFPTLPELFFILGFACYPTTAFGLELIGVAALAEIIGILTLYFLVEHVRIPARINRLVGKYTEFLVMGDERLLLLNRVAPMIPFAGAFISIAKWNIGKSLIYIIVGCVVKYGLIMMMSDFFYDYFSSNDAQTYTLIFIFAVLVASFALSIWMKKRSKIPN